MNKCTHYIIAIYHLQQAIQAIERRPESPAGFGPGVQAILQRLRDEITVLEKEYAACIK